MIADWSSAWDTTTPRRRSKFSGRTECVQTVTGLAPDRYHSIIEPTKKEAARIAISPGTSGQL